MLTKRLLLGSGLLAGGYFTKQYFKGGVNKNEPDMTGKIVIVTGGNSGIGLEAARKFYELNAKVIITGRDAKKAEKFMNSLEKDSNKPEMKFIKVDFSDLNQVKSLSENLKDEVGKVDLLVNNAGAVFTKYLQTQQGIEMTMGVNHLAHFYLTSLIWPLLENSEESRIINVSSIAHEKLVKKNRPNFEDYWFNKKDKVEYDESLTGMFNIYGESKLSNIFFTKTLSEKIDGKNLKIKTTTLHPGVVLTDFERGFESMKGYGVLKFLFYPFRFIFFKDMVDGAQTTLHCSLIPWEDLESGAYYKDCEIAQPTSVARDPKNVKESWDMSVEKLKELMDYSAFENLRSGLDENNSSE